MSEPAKQDLLDEMIRAIDTIDAPRLERALQEGADPNSMIGMDTALTRAIRMYRTPDDLATVIALYAAGADMTATNLQNDTPLIAVLTKHIQEKDAAPLIEFLLAAGPDASYAPHGANSPLVTALEMDFIQRSDWRIKRMLAAGADPDMPVDGLLEQSPIRPRTLRDALDMTVEWGVFQGDLSAEDRTHCAHLRSLLPPLPALVNQGAVKDRALSASQRFKLKGPRP